MKNKIFFRISFVLIMVLTFSAIFIGFYEIFMDKSEAAMYNCYWDKCYGSEMGDCSAPTASISCYCSGGLLNVCMIGEPI